MSFHFIAAVVKMNFKMYMFTLCFFFLCWVFHSSFHKATMTFTFLHTSLNVMANACRPNLTKVVASFLKVWENHGWRVFHIKIQKMRIMSYIPISSIANNVHYKFLAGYEHTSTLRYIEITSFVPFVNCIENDDEGSIGGI